MPEKITTPTMGESVKWSAGGTSISMLTDDWQIVACLATMTVLIAAIEYLRCRLDACGHAKEE